MNIIRDYGTSTELESEENSTFPHVDAVMDTQNQWTKILNVKFIIYCSVIVVGFILNLVVIIVYARKLQKSTYIFSLSLAACDLINCLIVSLDILKSVDVLPESTRHAVCIAYPYLVDTGCLVSAGLVVCLAIDRYIRSKHLKYSLSRAHSLTLVAGIVISSIIVTSPLLIARTARLVRPNLLERDLMCGELYSHHHLHYTETDGIKFSNPMLFMLVFNGVILTVLSIAAVTMTTLYLKMSLEIREKSFSRRSKLLSQTQNREQMIYEREKFREVKFDEASIDSSQISSDGCQELTSDIPTKLTVKVVTIENDKCKRESQENVAMRRKPSLFSTGKQSPSKIITSRYYCLIVSSILLFSLYFIHFILHIINICQLDNAHQSNMRHILFKCLDHSYIICFILNPVVYSFFNRSFFRNFKQIFCCDKRHERRRSSVDSSFL